MNALRFYEEHEDCFPDLPGLRVLLCPMSSVQSDTPERSASRKYRLAENKASTALGRSTAAERTFAFQGGCWIAPGKAEHQIRSLSAVSRRSRQRSSVRWTPRDSSPAGAGWPSLDNVRAAES